MEGLWLNTICTKRKQIFPRSAGFWKKKKEDMIIISRNGKPVLKVTLFEQSPRSSLFGAGKGLFTIPEDFDDIDISDDFEEEILPR